MTRAFAILLAASLVGCAGPQPLGIPTCRSDSECSENEICFPLQGCGDPGGGLVVEVQGNTRTGQLAQDFLIGDGGLLGKTDFTLLPATLNGEFVRDGVSYINTVTVRARGESELIPGVVRSYQATFTKPERGAYSLPVGAGKYLVTAETEDEAIPPLESMLSVSLGTAQNVNFTFAPADNTIVLTGRLLKRIDPGPIELDIPVQLPMDVQALDRVTLRPLSQRARVTAAGDFFLFVAPEAQALGAFIIVATPREPGSLVPSKTFPITLPADPKLRLLMGEFGDPLPQMMGSLKTTAGIAVPGASVYLEGPVNGGGVFRSKVVTTDANGAFRVDLLPSSSEGSYLLTALPPPNSVAGVTQAQLRTMTKTGQLPYLQLIGSVETTSVVTCPDKITVIGSIRRPGGADPAIGTTVVARAIEQLKERGKQPLPMGDSEVKTDESGRFSLELDPGIYQLDFVPGEDLPRTSRVVTVRAVETEVDAGPASKSVDLKESELRKGRKVSGAVRAPNAISGMLQFAEYATVRYFRVSAVGGTTTSLLLGEAVTDSMGNYSVILPAK